MGEYTTARATAARLIAKKGRDITLRKTSRTLSDPSKPWDGTDASDTNLTVKGVILDYEVENVDGALVRMGDKMALVAASTVEGASATADLKTFDRLIDSKDSTEWQIAVVEPLDPGDEAVIYEIQIRK